MRLLILSDIHANADALDAAFRTAEGRWDRALCLGDVVGYGPDPNEVTDRVRVLDILTIRGNHDKAVTGLVSAEDFNPAARAASDWTRAQLRGENLEFLIKLPPGPVQAEGVVLVHGAYHDEDEYVFAAEQALSGLLESPAALTFFGHTHLQGGFSYRDSQLEVLHLRADSNTGFSALRLEPSKKYLLNPGSIGQPRDSDPRAAFAVADLEHGVVEFWRVPYNIPAVQQRMRQAGLPEPLALRLSFGR